MSSLILRTDISGQAMHWIGWQEAVLLYSKDQIAWTLGDESLRYYGGINRVSNKRSYIDVHPIVAAKGVVTGTTYKTEPSLTNQELFRRDNHTCMYCLTSMPDWQLTRDHILPLSRGGRDVWTNVISACRECNQRKADHLLKESGMKLHAVPYTPNHAEWLILNNHNILADQMAFLKTQCPKERRHME